MSIYVTFVENKPYYEIENIFIQIEPYHIQKSEKIVILIESAMDPFQESETEFSNTILRLRETQT